MSAYREQGREYVPDDRSWVDRVISDLARAARHGSDIASVVLHPNDYRALVVELGSRASYDDGHLVMFGVTGPVSVTASIDNPPGVIQLS